MKKTVLFLFLLSSAGLLRAQFTKGQTAISGGIGFATSSNESIAAPATKQTITNFSVAPSLVFFSSPVMMSSVGLYYAHGTTKTVTGSSTANNNLDGVGAFFTRTRLNRLANRFYFTYGGTISGSLLFSKNTTSPAVADNSSSSWVASLGGNLGLLYQLNNRLILTTNLNNILSVNFSHGVTKTGGVTAVKSNSFNLATGLSGIPLNNLSVGVMFLLK